MPPDPIPATGDPHARVAGARTRELFDEHSRMIYGLCRTLLRDPDDADDATQATFLSAYRSLRGGTVPLEPAAWLATIARNECRARARARMREPLPLLEADVALVEGPDAEVERSASVEALRRAIADLPARQREAVVLRDLYGLHYAEVGAALGMSVASVESLLFRARRRLRVSLKPLATGAITVPVAVREGVAEAIPAFATGGATGGGTAASAVGLGVLAKFASGPATVKAVASVAAAMAAGSIAAAGVEHRQTPPRNRVAAAPVHAVAPAGDRAASASSTGTNALSATSRRRGIADVRDDRSGPRSEDDHGTTRPAGGTQRHGSDGGSSAGGHGSDDTDGGALPSRDDPASTLAPSHSGSPSSGRGSSGGSGSRGSGNSGDDHSGPTAGEGDHSGSSGGGYSVPAGGGGDTSGSSIGDHPGSSDDGSGAPSGSGTMGNDVLLAARTSPEGPAAGGGDSGSVSPGTSGGPGRDGSGPGDGSHVGGDSASSSEGGGSGGSEGGSGHGSDDVPTAPSG